MRKPRGVRQETAAGNNRGDGNEGEAVHRKARLTYAPDKANTDPLKRFVLSVYRMRAYAPCGTTWPCREPDEEHVCKCFKHAGHRGYHKCNCGAVHRRKPSDG